MTKPPTEKPTDRPRFSLASIQAKRTPAPPRICIYGPYGIGKTTFGAHAEKAIVIPTEDGLGTIDVPTFPLCTRYQDVLDAIAALYTEDHDYRTVVLDSLDWLEMLIWTVCAVVPKEGGAASIEGHGYGKGYVIAADRMRDVFDGLTALRDKKNMAIVLTAHVKVKRFDDPTTEPYDRYSLKLNDKAAALVSEWVDVLGFASQEMAIKREDVGFNKKAARALSIGGHVLHLARTPAYDAKNRYNLPDALPLEWQAFAAAFAANNQPTTKE